MTLIRALRAVIATCVVGAAFVVVPSSPAHAQEGEPIIVKAEEGLDFKREYGILAPPGDAAGEFHDPEGCAKAPFCMTIPMEILLPEGYDPDYDEFTMPLTVDWEDARVQGRAGVNGQGNDLAVYIWYGEKFDGDGDGDKEWVEYRHKDGADRPEAINMFQPDDGKYFLVVSNFSGVNMGFTVTLGYNYRGVPRDDGSVAPVGVRPRPGSGSGASTGSPAADDTTPARTLPTFTPSSPSFDPAPVLTPDLLPAVPGGEREDGFASAFPGGLKPLAEDLAGSGGVDLTAAGRRQLGPPSPVSGGVIAFWLGLVPILLVAAAGAVVIRRRPTALTLPIPVAA